MHIAVKTQDISLFRRENPGKLPGKLIDIRIKPDSPAHEVNAVEKLMAEHINGFFKTVENKAVGVETAFSEP
jgi:hypothetical protein